jgi:hypothetical protein
MISNGAMRRLGPIFVGLYLIVQICGVAPLMSCHSAHAGAASSLLAECSDGTLPHQNRHHAGDADDAVHHHALQEPALALSALIEADPVLLERPPKPFLSV